VCPSVPSEGFAAVTTEWPEWDWPPRRRPRVEILPPERQFVRVTIERRRPNLVPLLIIVAVAVIVLRLGIGPFVMAAALLGMLPHH